MSKPSSKIKHPEYLAFMRELKKHVEEEEEGKEKEVEEEEEKKK